MDVKWEMMDRWVAKEEKAVEEEAANTKEWRKKRIGK